MKFFPRDFERYLPQATLFFLVLYLLGLFFPVRAAQVSGFWGIVTIAVLALLKGIPERRNTLWIIACGLMLVAGLWGRHIAPDAVSSWRYFWAYQMIGKGMVCALALLVQPLSLRQVRWLLGFLLAMLLARNASMIDYAYHNPVFLGGSAIGSETQLLGLRNQGDHIVLLFPFVLASFLSWRKWHVVLSVIAVVEIILLASTGWRGAWVGFAGGCLVLLVVFRAWRELAFLLVLTIAIGMLALAVSDGNIVAQAIGRGASASNRVDLVWKPVLEILAESGWQGHGFGQARYLEVISAYSVAHPERGIPVLGDAHNMMLNFAMAAGWIGLLAFFAVLLVGIGLCAQRMQEVEAPPELRALLSGVVASWVGTYGLLGLTDQPHYNNLAVLAALTSIALVSIRSKER